MGNPPTDERPKRLDFWLTAQTKEILDTYNGNKADYVNRAIVAYWEMTHQELKAQLIYDSVEDLVIINAWPFNHPGDQRWIRPLKVAADRNDFLKPYAFLYNKAINVEQGILIPRAMEPQWSQFLGGQACKIESRIVVTLGTYIDIDDKLHTIIQLVNERGRDPMKRAVVWVPQA